MPLSTGTVLLRKSLKLAAGSRHRGSSTTIDAATSNSVKNITKNPVETASAVSTSGPPMKSSQATARNQTTALIAILMTAGCTPVILGFASGVWTKGRGVGCTTVVGACSSSNLKETSVIGQSS